MTQTAPRTQFFLAWTIWASFLASLAILLVLALLWPDTRAVVLNPKPPIVSLRTFAYVLAIVLFPITGGIRRRMERKHRSGSFLADAPSPKSSAGSSLTGLVLALALAETIGILGFILFLFGDSLQTLYIFFGLSALAMLLHHPKAEPSE